MIMQADLPHTIFQASAELEFRVTDENCFLILESGRHSCTLVLEKRVEQSNGTVLEFVAVTENLASTILTDALDWPSIVDAKIIDDTSEASLLQFVVTSRSLVTAVGNSDAIPKHISASNGVGRVVVAVPPSVDPQQVIDRFRARHPNSTLIARREHDVRPLFAEQSIRDQLLTELTDRQYEALMVAYESGYFARPRRTTATECAAELDITQSTFSQHIQAGLEKVLDTIFASLTTQ